MTSPSAIQLSPVRVGTHTRRLGARPVLYTGVLDGGSSGNAGGANDEDGRVACSRRRRTTRFHARVVARARRSDACENRAGSCV